VGIVPDVPAVLELDAVTVRYPGRARPALADATFQVSAGEVLAVIGPNGAGKSTLVRLLAATLRPSFGKILLHGRPIESFDRPALARELAVVSSQESVAFGYTVEQVVRMGRAPHQTAWMLPSADDVAAVETALTQCDLCELRNAHVDELSAGEQKRVAIARALSQKPRVLILDEPAAFLDVRHALDLCELLVAQARERQIACVVVMHDLNAAATFADRVMLLKEGSLLAVGAVAEVMTWQRLREAFDCDLYVGVNELTRDRYFVPMRAKS
jgi:iron complex transport system ATP-binding protein